MCLSVGTLEPVRQGGAANSLTQAGQRVFSQPSAHRWPGQPTRGQTGGLRQPYRCWSLLSDTKAAWVRETPPRRAAKLAANAPHTELQHGRDYPGQLEIHTHGLHAKHQQSPKIPVRVLAKKKLEDVNLTGVLVAGQSTFFLFKELPPMSLSGAGAAVGGPDGRGIAAHHAAALGPWSPVSNSLIFSLSLLPAAKGPEPYIRPGLATLVLQS